MTKVLTSQRVKLNPTNETSLRLIRQTTGEIEDVCLKIAVALPLETLQHRLIEMKGTYKFELGRAGGDLLLIPRPIPPWLGSASNERVGASLEIQVLTSQKILLF